MCFCSFVGDFGILEDRGQTFGQKKVIGVRKRYFRSKKGTVEGSEKGTVEGSEKGTFGQKKVLLEGSKKGTLCIEEHKESDI